MAMRSKEGVLELLTPWKGWSGFASLLYKEGQRYVFGHSPSHGDYVTPKDYLDEEEAVFSKSRYFHFLNFEFVSVQKDRPHCEIFCKYGSFYLKDLKTEGGTFLNATEVRGGRSRRLDTGDIISLGLEMTIEGLEGVIDGVMSNDGDGLRDVDVAFEVPIFRFTVQGTETGSTIKYDLRNGRSKACLSSPLLSTVQQYSPTASALNNPSILEEIFKFLSLQDLKKTRLVSKDWNVEAVKPLARVSLAKFKYRNAFHYRTPTLSTRIFNYVNQMQYFLNEAVNINVRYPVGPWDVRLPHQTSDPYEKFVWDVTQLLNAVKRNLRSLSLETDDGVVPFHGVIPFDKLKKVEFHMDEPHPLKDRYDYEEEERRTRLKNFVASVSNATFISLRGSGKLAGTFLNALSTSWKLENVQLTELVLRSTFEFRLEMLKPLSQLPSAKLKLVNLGGKLDFENQEYIVAFEEFLAKQGPTLEELKVSLRYWSPEQLILNFSSFPKLRCLYLHFFNFFPIFAFPGSGGGSYKNLYKVHLPAIESLWVQGTPSPKEMYSTFCAPEIDSSATTMKKLYISGCTLFTTPDPNEDAYWKERVSVVFPNLLTDPKHPLNPPSKIKVFETLLP